MSNFPELGRQRAEVSLFWSVNINPQHVQQGETLASLQNNGQQTSREERLAKAEAPSDDSLLLVSRNERLPGGRRCRGGRDVRPRPLQSTTMSEEQRQEGGQEEAGGSNTARRQRKLRKTGKEKKPTQVDLNPFGRSHSLMTSAGL